MALQAALDIRPGLTSIIGGGGKSTLLLSLGKELSKAGHKTILCTSTHMLPQPDVPLAKEVEHVVELFRKAPLVCFGVLGEDGKLHQETPIKDILCLADYVLCEADGSKHLPLKAHAPHEPNIPYETKRLVYVVGLDGIGQPISRVAHRPSLYAALLGADEEHIVSPGDVVRAILAEGYGTEITLLLNKAEGERLAIGKEVAALWPGRAVIACLEEAEPIKEIWKDGRKQEK